MGEFQASAYGPVFGPLLDVDRRRPLGPGSRDGQARHKLVDMTVERAFAHARLHDGDMGACCLSGVWLLYDYLDEAHRICQEIDTPSGSYWHAIVHRREGDFSNAKYWFRRIGRHEVFGPLLQSAEAIVAEWGGEKWGSRLISGGAWNANAFVDLVESVEHGRNPDARELCLDIQQAEWELLFDSCYRRAVGDDID